MELLVKNKFEELYNLAKSKNYDEKSLKLLERGFLYAYEKHINQKRKSGEPYIIHPLCAAILLVEWNMDIESVVAGLLHDVIEDCTVDQNEMIKEFGDSIVSLVTYVTKVSKISKKTRQDIEKNKDSGKDLNEDYTIQVFLSMSKDLRAMIIKLADRLHNMRTIDSLPYEKQVRIANETFAVYANVAGRLGMYDIKTELLDRSFKVLQPKEYNETVKLVDRMVEINSKSWADMNTKLENLLKISNLRFTLKTRIKGYYSTYRKLQSGVELKNIHDIFATRVIVDSAIECYHVLGLVHLNFVYLKGAFKDYISKPKINLYQSIHTTITVNDVLFEIQIRDEKMDLFAKYGVASHWKYKEKNTRDVTALATNTLITEFNSSKDKSVKDIKSISSSKIFDVLILNDNEWYAVTDSTTVLDVAYRFDSQKLPWLMATYVNGRKSTFDQRLESGDTLKFVYTEAYPLIKSNWINAVTNHAAKSYINDYLEKTSKHKPKLDLFLEEVDKCMNDQKANDHEIYKRLKEEFNFNSISQWWNLVTSCKDFEKQETKEQLINFFSNNREKYLTSVEWIKGQAANWVMESSYFNPIEDVYFNKLELANCCVKLPGMEIIGVLKNDILHVHNANCPKAKIVSSKRIVMSWNETALINHPRKFAAKIKLIGPWTETVGNKIAKIIDNKRANLASINITKIKDNLTYVAEILAYFRDINHLNNIMLVLEADNIITKYQLI